MSYTPSDGYQSRIKAYGLSNKQQYWIFQSLVVPKASEVYKESDKSIPEFEIASNMFRALLVKYRDYSYQEKKAFVKMAKAKYEELL